MDEAVFNALKTCKNLSWKCNECLGSQVVNNNDRGLELIMKKLEAMSSDIDELKEKSVPKSTFSGLFQGNGDTPRGSKRTALLNGNGDASNATFFGKRKRLESKVNTPAIIMGTGAVNNDLVAVKPLKWLYVAMLHPDTTEESVMKLLSNALKIAKTEFTCVKLLPKGMQTPTYISFKVGMSDDLFEKSLDPAFWSNGVAIREFVSRYWNSF
jgi:hypothetical protein